MREVIFRAWHRKDKCWHYYTLIDLIIGRAGQAGSLGYENWCQYTGLKDSAGKEIYEGDILQFEYDGELCIAGAVKWREEVSMWAADIGLGLTTIEPEDAWVPDTYKIIGNIHENQELLEAI